MAYRIWLFLLSLCLVTPVVADYSRGQFEIIFERSKMVVHSPPRFKMKGQVFLRNQTPEIILLKVLQSSGKLLNFVTIASGEDKTIGVDFKNAQDFVTIMPLVPSLQEIDLSYGKPTYEIPPAQK